MVNAYLHNVQEIFSMMVPHADAQLTFMLMETNVNNVARNVHNVQQAHVLAVWIHFIYLLVIVILASPIAQCVLLLQHVKNVLMDSIFNRVVQHANNYRIKLQEFIK